MTRLEHFMAKIAAETYAEPRTSGHDHITSKVAPMVAELLPAKANILDVGSGQGNALEWFGERGFNITGIDVNDANIRECINKGFVVTRCDQNAMPGEWSGAFDCVWARHVLEHSIAPFFTLHEFARVLKPGGILYAEVPMPDTSCVHESNVNHYSVLGARMWGCLIDRAGFELIKTTEMKMNTGAGPDQYTGFTARKLP